MIWRRSPLALLFGVFLAASAYGQEVPPPPPPPAPPGPPSAPSQDSSPNSTAGEARRPLHPMRIKIGGNVQLARLIHVVRPTYPEDAKKKNVSGSVVLHGIISRDGTVRSVDLVSGPPELADAAMDAVRQWRYAPTLLGGEPVEVDTKINVVFNLSPTRKKSPNKQSSP